MGQVASQLGLDQTYFIQFGLFLIVFVVLSRLYFKPFLALFLRRHEKTVQDREAAERMAVEAEKKLREYDRLLSRSRREARQVLENALTEARKEEASIFAEARERAKDISQTAAREVEKQRASLKNELHGEITAIAGRVAEKLLAKNR